MSLSRLDVHLKSVVSISMGELANMISQEKISTRLTNWPRVYHTIRSNEHWSLDLLEIDCILLIEQGNCTNAHSILWREDFSWAIYSSDIYNLRSTIFLQHLLQRFLSLTYKNGIFWREHNHMHRAELCGL